jgi:hypothetical protein
MNCPYLRKNLQVLKTIFETVKLKWKYELVE